MEEISVLASNTTEKDRKIYKEKKREKEMLFMIHPFSQSEERKKKKKKKQTKEEQLFVERFRKHWDEEIQKDEIRIRMFPFHLVDYIFSFTITPNPIVFTCCKLFYKVKKNMGSYIGTADHGASLTNFFGIRKFVLGDPI